jgi:ABC-type lipoprotein export system ATPase subunit
MIEKISASCLIETDILTPIYGGGEEIRLLDDVNIKIERGEFISVMGSSGSGKSTLLNMIGALDVPTSGSILMDGQKLVDIRERIHFAVKRLALCFNFIT